MLFDCDWVRAMWFGSNVQLDVGKGHPVSAQRWMSQVVDVLNGKDLTRFLSRVIKVAWHIWKSKNEFIFSSNPINPKRTVRRADEASCEFSKIRVQRLIHMDNHFIGDVSSLCRAPNQGQFKLNCGIAIKKEGHEVALAVAQRNWKGQIVDGRASLVHLSSPLHGELLAIRFADIMAQELGHTRAVIESGNQIAIKLSVSELVPPWEVDSWVREVNSRVKDIK